MKKLLLVASLCVTSLPVLQADLPVSYDPNEFRSGGRTHPAPQPDRRFVVTSPTQDQFYLSKTDKIVTVTFPNGKKQRYVMSNDKLYRLEEDKSFREFVRGLSGDLALIAVGVFGGVLLTYLNMLPPVRSGR